MIQREKWLICVEATVPLCVVAWSTHWLVEGFHQATVMASGSGSEAASKASVAARANCNPSGSRRTGHASHRLLRQCDGDGGGESARRDRQRVRTRIQTAALGADFLDGFESEAGLRDRLGRLPPVTVTCHTRESASPAPHPPTPQLVGEPSRSSFDCAGDRHPADRGEGNRGAGGARSPRVAGTTLPWNGILAGGWRSARARGKGPAFHSGLSIAHRRGEEHGSEASGRMGWVIRGRSRSACRGRAGSALGRARRGLPRRFSPAPAPARCPPPGR